MIAKVVLEKTTPTFDKAYSYNVPKNLMKKVCPGVRVLVPFGRGNAKRRGIVFYTSDKIEQGLKDIYKVLDESAVLSDELLKLSWFLRDTCYCTAWDAVSLLIPSGLDVKVKTSYIFNFECSENKLSSLEGSKKEIVLFLKKKSVYVNFDTIFHTLKIEKNKELLDELETEKFVLKNSEYKNKIGDATLKNCSLTEQFLSYSTSLKLTQKQKIVVDFLKEVKTASYKEICYFTGTTQAVIKGLENKGVINSFDVQYYRRPKQLLKVSSHNKKVNFNKEQQQVFNGLYELLKKDEFDKALLFGVTGSGKTAVYLSLCEKCLECSKNAIIMVPEISLTPQLLNIFYNRFGDMVAIFHSGLSMGERFDEWKRVNEKKARIAIGTRSAVFAPMDNIGLIVIDEEQESSYKSDMTPRFNARDAAEFRARYNNALLLLASATPSITTFAKAKSGQFKLFKLDKRYGNSILPDVETVETNIGETVLSQRLCNAVDEVLKSGKQAIILLNRRGYNTFVSCTACKMIRTCPNCSISLTYHSANNRLMCHYCGYSEPFSKYCPSCHNESLTFFGTGTQKLEDELFEYFPNAKICRLDSDSVSKKNTYADALNAFSNGEYDILLGTQMVAKGLDFPNVTLVGVISIDSMLFNDDYKSGERAFDLLTQVVGRAGRGKYRGKAIVQTSFPDNEIIALAEKQDYELYFDIEMKFRKAMLYPPFCDIVAVNFSGVEERLVKLCSKSFFYELIKIAEKEKVSLKLLGPNEPKYEMIAGKHRMRIIIKCISNSKTRNVIRETMNVISEDRRYKNVSLSIDSSPESLI